MLTLKSSDSTEDCTSCCKNSSLIKKYEELIRLYKKRQIKNSKDGSSRLSNGPTISTLEMHSLQNPHLKLVQVLSILLKKRCSSFFRYGWQRPVKKLLLLGISNKIQRNVKIEAFKLLKNRPKTQNTQLWNILQRKQQQNLGQAFVEIRRVSGISVIQQLLTENNISNQEITKKAIQQIAFVKDQIARKDCSDKQIFRMNVELQLKNKKLTIQNKILRESLIQSSKRQAKQNQKKKESLEMLAEQLQQKNQQLHSLKQTLKAYEQTYKKNNNVLQDDAVELRIDLDSLESINKRLNNDLDRLKQQLQAANKNITEVNQKYEKLRKENEIHLKDSELCRLKSIKCDRATEQFEKLLKIVDKKIKRINIYQKQILTSKNAVEKCLKNLQQQLKSEIILMFINNISVIDYELQCPNLFDNQQKQLLISHKLSFLKLQSTPALRKIQSNNKMDNLDFSQIQAPASKQLDSIFMALDSPRQQPERQSSTIKMLELELQKNRQRDKVSELKEKILHIRMVILKLLSSLEIQQKNGAEDMIQLLFNIFQYSEEERNSIFAKKKKLFGLI